MILMAHEKVYAICENMCMEETMTKKEILEKIAEGGMTPEEIENIIKDVTYTKQQLNPKFGVVLYNNVNGSYDFKLNDSVKLYKYIDVSFSGGDTVRVSNYSTSTSLYFNYTTYSFDPNSVTITHHKYGISTENQCVSMGSKDIKLKQDGTIVIRDSINEPKKIVKVFGYKL